MTTTFTQSEKTYPTDEGGILEKSNGKIIHYTKHFLARMQERKMGKNNLPVSNKSVAEHVSKIMDFVNKNPHKGSGYTKYAFVHKKTGHKIVAHVSKDGAELHTYLDHDQPIDNITKNTRVKNGQIMRQEPAKVAMLEDILYEMVKSRMQDYQVIELD